MLILFVLVAMAVVGGVAVLMARGGPILEDDPAPGRPLSWPDAGPVVPDDLDQVRFGVGRRGYRMDQVDRVLADARRALEERDRTIEALRRGQGAATLSGDPASGAQGAATLSGDPASGAQGAATLSGDPASGAPEPGAGDGSTPREEASQ